MFKQIKMQDYYRYLRRQGYRHTTAMTSVAMRFSPDQATLKERLTFLSLEWNKPEDKCPRK